MFKHTGLLLAICGVISLPVQAGCTVETRNIGGKKIWIIKADSGVCISDEAGTVIQFMMDKC